MKEDGKEKRNHNGQKITDKPSDKLINPPDRNHPKKPERGGNDNITAKDTNRGSRNPILR